MMQCNTISLTNNISTNNTGIIRKFKNMQDWGKALFVSSFTAGMDPNIGLERSIVVYKRIDLIIYQLVNIHLTNTKLS